MDLFFSLCRKVKKGSLLIDSSTIDPTVSKEMAAAAEKMGAVLMDAPVSGGTFLNNIFFFVTIVSVLFLKSDAYYFLTDWPIKIFICC